jgi:DNA-binding MarR family transcriptional regulator
MRADAAAFVGSEFTIEDFQTLHALMVQPYPVEATPAQLAEATNVTRAGMTSRLDRLVESGLVTREVDPLDRRRLLVRPTPAGREAWDNAVHEGMTREQHLLHALSPRELEQLNTLLRKVILSFDD